MRRKRCGIIRSRFSTISSQFFSILPSIFHKTEIQTVILRCWTGLNHNWFKSYDTKHKWGGKVAVLITQLFFRLSFSIYSLAVACKIHVWNRLKNTVHQTWYFKLENCKNQVEIDRRSRCFGTTLALKIIFTTVSICFIRSVVSQEKRKNWKRYGSQASTI